MHRAMQRSAVLAIGVSRRNVDLISVNVIHSFERVLILSLYSRTGHVEVCVESRDQVNNPPELVSQPPPFITSQNIL